MSDYRPDSNGPDDTAFGQVVLTIVTILIVLLCMGVPFAIGWLFEMSAR